MEPEYKGKANIRLSPLIVGLMLGFTFGFMFGLILGLAEGAGGFSAVQGIILGTMVAILAGVIGGLISDIILIPSFDNTIKTLCARLRERGFDARISEREDPMLRHVPSVLWTSVMILPLVLRLAKNERIKATIEIAHGPIRKFSAVEFPEGDFDAFTIQSRSCCWVPDPRLSDAVKNITIWTKRVKTFPLFGRVTDVEWVGRDSDTGLLLRLNGDRSLKIPVMHSRDVTVRSIPNEKCWVLCTKGKIVPSIGLWICYESIARHLLTDPLPSR